MTIFNAGTLSNVPFHKIERVSLLSPRDIYTFTIPGNSPIVPSVNLNASIHNAVDGSANPITPSFRIFEDTNKDGKLTVSGANADKFISGVDSNSPFNEGPINFAAHAGNYFAVVDRPAGLADSVNTAYQVDFSTTPFRAPSNLIPVKLPLGNLNGEPNQEKTFSGSISTSNTSDVFSFTLSSGAATITLNGMDETDDVDLRVIRDDGDRIFENNEIVAASVKPAGGEESVTLTQPGEYLVQLYQFEGNTKYNLTIASTNSLSGSSLTGIKVASAKEGSLHGNSRDSILAGLWNADRLYGHNGDDILLGNAGRDVLVGGADDDQMFGGEGRDTLRGNAGRDTFILARQTGWDVFKDFQVREDYLGLANNLTFDQLSFTQTRQGTFVKAGNESLAFLKGVDRSQLSASDFVQVDLAKLTANVAGLG